MKKIIALLASLAILSGCGGNTAPAESLSAESLSAESQPAESQPAESPAQNPSGGEAASGEASEETGEEGGVLVVYFSATGTTRGVAQELGELLDAQVWEIQPQTPYTQEDLDYGDDSCRANREQNDPDARPAIQEVGEEVDQARILFLGYPIWWGQAPKVISTFLEEADLSGKTIVPFCTSGSSPLGTSAENLHQLAPGARWLEGRRFGQETTSQELAQWLDSLELEE